MYLLISRAGADLYMETVNPVFELTDPRNTIMACEVTPSRFLTQTICIRLATCRRCNPQVR
jgi:hypothetical protein